MFRRTLPGNFACCLHPSLLHYSPATPTDGDTRSDTCFEIHNNTVKFGRYALREVGRDCHHLGHGGTVALLTDSTIARLPFFQDVLRSLKAAALKVEVYDKTRVEPTDGSFVEAAAFLRGTDAKVVLSVGGGSVLDTAKAANLFAKYPRDNILDYVNAPVGKGMPCPGPLLPHIACPTTCGTGSECTPFAICDIVSMNCKSGISSREITPTMAIVDPQACDSLPKAVIAASGFDVLSHSIESYTARPYTSRLQLFPRDPSRRVARPPFNGSNPYSDMACERALQLLGRSYKKAVATQSQEAIDDMTLASMLAGTAMGNAGCHLPHAMSYPLSGLITDAYRAPVGYPHHSTGHPTLPHGYSVALGAPSTVRHMAKAIKTDEMRRRLSRCDEFLTGGQRQDSGEYLADTLIDIMRHNGMPLGIETVGFSVSQVSELVKRCIPQKRLVDNAPWAVTEEDLTALYMGAMRY